MQAFLRIMKTKILFISLGCDKNLVDSEHMIGLLAKEGFIITDDETGADVIIINSCAFIGDAKEESINTIIEMSRYKSIGKCRCLGICGCLAQRYTDEIIKEFPEVDFCIGTNSWDSIVDAVNLVLPNQLNEATIVKKAPLCGLPSITSNKRLITTGGHYAYLKIADGCDKNCTYCAIPSMRGEYRSYPLEDILEEAKNLVNDGVKELILVAQETTLYGKDLYGEKSLYKLLNELQKIEDLHWIRIMYCYPEEIDDNLISAIKNNSKVLHYLDLPMQHASDEVLRRMGRHTTGEELADIIDKLREEIPDIALRTSLITGFPGETDEDFVTLMEFLNWAELDRVGVFTYSREEGTPAHDFADQVDDVTMNSRRGEAMELLQEISADKNASYIGDVLECFVEGYSANDNVYVARSYRDAPGVDGYIFIDTDEVLTSGDFVKVKITAAKDYDLIGELYECA